MNRLATILLTVMTVLLSHKAIEASRIVQTDYDALTSTLMEGLNSLLDRSVEFDGASVYLEYTGPVTLSHDARQTVDAHIKGLGAVLSPASSHADKRLTVTITDASVVTVPSEEGCTRTVSVTLHIIAAQSNGTVITAKGATFSDSSHIPKDAIGKTIDANRFSRSVERTNVKGTRTAVLATSLLIVSAVLTYFTFNY